MLDEAQTKLFKEHLEKLTKACERSYELFAKFQATNNQNMETIMKKKIVALNKQIDKF